MFFFLPIFVVACQVLVKCVCVSAAPRWIFSSIRLTDRSRSVWKELFLLWLCSWWDLLNIFLEWRVCLYFLFVYISSYSTHSKLYWISSLNFFLSFLFSVFSLSALTESHQMKIKDSSVSTDEHTHAHRRERTVRHQAPQRHTFVLKHTCKNFHAHTHTHPLGKPCTITARMGFILSLQQLINCILQIVRFSRTHWWGTVRTGALGETSIIWTCIQN